MGARRSAFRACPVPALPVARPVPAAALASRVPPPGLATPAPAWSLAAGHIPKRSGACHRSLARPCDQLRGARPASEQSRPGPLGPSGPPAPPAPGTLAKRGHAALAGNRTRVNCLEGSYAHHYTTNAAPPGRRPHDAATPLTPDSAQRSLRRRPPLTALPAQGDRPNHSHTHGSAAPRSPSPAHARLAHSRSHSHARAGVPGHSRLLAAATRRASPGRRPRDPLRAGHHPDPPGTPVAQAQRGARRAFPHTWSPTRSGLAWEGAVGAAGKRVRWRHVAGPAASKRV